MTRGLELLWKEIEASGLPARTGWVRRLANSGAIVSVHAAVACQGGARSLMMDIPLAAIASLQELPRTGGLSVALVPPLQGVPSDQRTLAVELEDAQFADIFAIFCADLVEGISGCRKTLDAIVLLLGRLERWQEFLRQAIDGLGHREMIGLFGELWVLRHILVPCAGIGMIASWTGAQRAPQDFIVPGVCAVEVKTSTARTRSDVRIHGERQLDDTGLTCLFLAYLGLEGDNTGAGGQSLRGLVNELRDLAVAAPEFSVLLDRRLAQAGWLDRHAARYEQLRMRVVQRRFFRVGSGFPRVVPDSLPSGIGEVDYELDLKMCGAWECEQEEVAVVIRSLHPGDSDS